MGSQEDGKAAARRRAERAGTLGGEPVCWRERLPPCGRFGLFVYVPGYHTLDGPVAEVECLHGRHENWWVITLFQDGKRSDHDKCFADAELAMTEAEKLVGVLPGDRHLYAPRTKGSIPNE